MRSTLLLAASPCPNRTAEHFFIFIETSLRLFAPLFGLVLEVLDLAKRVSLDEDSEGIL